MADAGQQLRFSVVSFAGPGVPLAVVGSCPSLGQWDPQKAVVMQPRHGDMRLQSEPDFHWADIFCPEVLAGEKVEYKFLEKHGHGVKWEELGANKNRCLDRGAFSDSTSPLVLLEVVRFADPNGAESDHTARFYQGVKERGEISIRKVLNNLYVGSCPRQQTHIETLNLLGVTCVVNFQTEEDCKRNCVAGIGMEEDPLAVSRIYESKGMQYIWMPTFDMSTDGRAQMLPQASFLFAELIRRGHTVYSHCNAGVGRSVAAACGYLVFALGLEMRQMQHVMASCRPVAFFDFEALNRARDKYQKMFGKDTDAEADKRCKEEALALL
ncbi:unnamed protein product [Effrenium voratum]|uniref:Uncharacterized protein n=1 Tax=Effrenium voratum TaxID=2562239 RepID=A0AA36NEP5_9DINO|nr:unnamed protein product [Effrenium voratum]CAJ1403489.1 unnamed protein product [Effrenium voratum]CAJ1458993.1 unnamed protein product [Effrenium voratum]